MGTDFNEVLYLPTHSHTQAPNCRHRGDDGSRYAGEALKDLYIDCRR